MIRSLLLAAAAASAIGATATDRDDLRPDLGLRIGYHLLNADGRSASSLHGWTAGGDARLPMRGWLGSAHVDADWRSNQAAAGRLDALTAMYVERRSMDAGGVYVGGGAGLGLARYAPGDDPPDDAPGTSWGLAPAGKALVGYAWRSGLGVEAAYVLSLPVHGLRTDGIIAALAWRFDPP